MTFADTSNIVRACLHVLLFESTWSPKLRRMSYTSIFFSFSPPVVLSFTNSAHRVEASATQVGPSPRVPPPGSQPKTAPSSPKPTAAPRPLLEPDKAKLVFKTACRPAHRELQHSFVYISDDHP